jgi:serine phosphatase RsbU (regulator of sigma subunit)
MADQDGERRVRPGGAGDANAPAIRILLIEDDAGDALLVQEMLAQSGAAYSYAWESNLAGGLRALDDGADCILVDLGLPDSQDLEVVDAVLAHAPGAAVIVLTGFDDRSAGSRAVAAGAQDYLVKGGVDHETLMRSIRYAIARRNSEESFRQLSEAQILEAENSRLERGLIAQPMVDNPELRWSTRYEAGGRRALLGGDFFHAIEMEDGTIRIVVGDVCGHGPDEAALGVALRIAWRALVLAHQPPEETIQAVQRVLESERNSEEVFATLCDIELHPGLRRAQLRLAGHPNPLLLVGSEAIEVPADVRGPVLGVFDQATWPPTCVDLPDDWTLVVFTDGIIEGRGGEGGGRFEATGIARVAGESSRDARDLGELADTLIAAAELANGEPLKDDVALVILSTSARWHR